MKALVQKIPIKDIKVVGKHRPLVEKKLPVITDSLDKIGLKTPITVRKAKKGNSGYVLVAGRHRLEAAKSLGWDEIDCMVVAGRKIDRQLWTEAENLHRAGLTALQRAKAIQRWERLLKERETGEDKILKGGHQPGDKGLSKTAKRLGVTRETVRRSRGLASLSPKAEKAAEATGLDRNESALLKVAKQPTSSGQVKKVHELAKKRKRNPFLPLDEIKQFKALKRAFANAPKFKKAWNDASAVVRQKFVKTVLKPNSKPRK
jgi:ParB family chromosome partitioning protein